MGKFLSTLATFCIVCCGLTAQESTYSDWSDKSGDYTTRAVFVSLSENEVTLRKEDGEIVKINLSDLATGDADRARDLAGQSAQATTPPLTEPDQESVSSSSDDELIQDRIDSIETPGKTAFWPYIRWFYGFIAVGENKRVEVADGEVNVVRELDAEGALIYDPSVFLSLSIADESKKDYYAPALNLIGIVGGFIAFIWMLVVMFRESAWWGCTYLIPCINLIVLLVFLIKNWSVAWAPFLLGVFFWVLTFLPAFLVPSWAPDYALLEAALGK